VAEPGGPAPAGGHDTAPREERGAGQPGERVAGQMNAGAAERRCERTSLANPEPLALAEAEREARAHAGGRLLIAGAPGSGLLACLAARVAALRERGVAPGEILVVGVAGAAAASLRGELRRRLGDRAEDHVVVTLAELCLTLVRDQAHPAGSEPFLLVATRAERLALLLERFAAHARGISGWRAERRLVQTLASALARIDHLKASLVRVPRPDDAHAWDPATGEPDFATIYREHERLLAERGAIDTGGLLPRASALLDGQPAVRASVAESYSHLVLGGLDLPSRAGARVVALLAHAIGDAALAGDAETIAAFGTSHAPARMLVLTDAAGGSALRAARASLGRSPLAASGAGSAERRKPATPRGDQSLAFWLCADEHAQARCVAADIERLRAERAESRIGVLVRSLARDGQAVVAALKERGIGHRVQAASAVLAHAEVRDLLAWLRLLADPLDTNAVMRLLMRPPVSLRPAELAQTGQLARRMRLDMILALERAVESERLRPEARERIGWFLSLHQEIAGLAEGAHPAELVHEVVERSGLRRARLLDSSAQAIEALRALARVERVAEHLARLAPHAGARGLAGLLLAAADAGISLEEEIAGPGDERWSGAPAGEGAEEAPVEVMSVDAAPQHALDRAYVVGLSEPLAAAKGHARKLETTLARALASVQGSAVLAYASVDGYGVAQRPLPAAERARSASALRWERREPPPSPRPQALDAMARRLRERVLEDVQRIGGQLRELRLDTDYDVSGGIVRYLELLKVSALAGRGVHDRAEGPGALQDLNSRLLSACTPLQRELFEASGLDRSLRAVLAPDPAASADAAALHRGDAQQALHQDDGEEELLAQLLPRHGKGLSVSASDIETYRACPLRYKFARLLRIPAEPTPQQRFGIVVHQTLERYHAAAGADVSARGEGALLRLLEAAWRRAGFGESPREQAFLEQARDALIAYHRGLSDHEGEPVWFERPFAFTVGAHRVRGRVDRVDRLPDGSYELIDYKTGPAKEPEQLAEDIQLSLYALAAERAWHVTASRQSYYYVLDNRKVPLPAGRRAPERRISDAIARAGEGIMGLRFEPAPSYSVCSTCDYLELCPAAEA
jgi:DNA helicase-2/ATP-dependent DNA helicase PcrA